MNRAKQEGGYTLTELLIVLAIIGMLAFPEMEHIKIAAKLTGVQTNYRSVLASIYGMQSTEDLAAKLTAQYGDALNPNVEDMTNPITDKMGVATEVDPANESPPALYVLDKTFTNVPSEVEQLDYKGAVVAIIKDNKCLVIYGCDENGKLMKGFQRTVQL
jgi:prepilin-type N-terminal cleavage/methylation domain-containing protein